MGEAVAAKVVEFGVGGEHSPTTASVCVLAAA
jgi:hypothetical protein